MKQSIRDLKRKREEAEFYEVMPSTANFFPVDDTPLEDEYRLINKETEKANLVAMVTLAAVMFGVIVLSVLFWRGLETIKNNLPNVNSNAVQSTANSSGSLEL